MRKGIIIVFMIAAVLMVAGVALAEVQNVKVSGDILMRAFTRDNYNLKEEDITQESNAVPTTGHDVNNYNANGLMSAIRLRVDADLTDNVSTTIRLLNERRWSNEEHNGNTHDNVMAIDLDLAYVTLKEFFYQPLTITIGRQELHFGNDLIMGDVNTNRSDYDAHGAMTGIEDWSSKKAFDAVRATLNYNTWTIDLVYSALRKNQVTLASTDANLYGINTKYDFGQYNAVAEGYFWYREGSVNNASGLTTTNDWGLTEKSQEDQLYTLGVRGNAEFIKDLVINGELAFQFGHQPGTIAGPVTPAGSIDAGTIAARRSGDRQAMAVQVGIDYTASKMKWTPKIGLWTSFFSGDHMNEQGTGTYHGWDPMFENQCCTRGAIANYLFAQTNSFVQMLTGSVNPIQDLTLFGSYSNYWLARSIGGNGQWAWFDAANGGIDLGTATALRSGHLYQVNTTNRHLGQEFDMGLTYNYTEDVEFGVLCGFYLPGKVFSSDNKATASLMSASMKVAF